MISRSLLVSASLILAVVAAPSAQAAGDPVKGKVVFAQCAACHKADASGKSTLGPNLWGVVGRPAGTLPGFTYSPAMKGAKRSWTPTNLDAYLIAPAMAVPGNRMPYAGLKAPADRSNLIAYLTTLK